jgi:hypothetical protein
MTQFTVKVQVDGKTQSWVAQGSLNEHANFPKALAGIETLKLDLRGVDFMNSVGITVWLRWLKESLALNPKISFEFSGVPYFLNRVFSEIKGMVPPKFKIKSLFVPYYCKPCDKNQTRLFTEGEEYEIQPRLSLVPPMVTCAKCRGPMEMDVIKEKFFSTLGRVVNL